MLRFSATQPPPQFQLSRLGSISCHATFRRLVACVADDGVTDMRRSIAERRRTRLFRACVTHSRTHRSWLRRNHRTGRGRDDLRHHVFTVHERIPVQTPGALTLLYPNGKRPVTPRPRPSPILPDSSCMPVRHAWNGSATTSTCTRSMSMCRRASRRSMWIFCTCRRPTARSGALVDDGRHRQRAMASGCCCIRRGWYARNLAVAREVEAARRFHSSKFAVRADEQRRNHCVRTDIAGDSGRFAGLCGTSYPADRSDARRGDSGSSALLGDSPANVQIAPAQVAALQSMVTQTQRLFRSQHYARYEHPGLAERTHFFRRRPRASAVGRKQSDVDRSLPMLRISCLTWI